VQTVEPILIAKEAVRDSVVVQERLPRCVVEYLTGLDLRIDEFSWARPTNRSSEPQVPAPARLSLHSASVSPVYVARSRPSPLYLTLLGYSSGAFIASGIGQIAALRRSTLVTAAAAVAVRLIAGADLAVWATSGAPTRSSLGA
jgi:hypothetical protein